jgi:hypothetical protein
MDNTTTLYEKHFASARPSKKTLENILNFSKAYSSKKLKCGFTFEMINN